MLRVPTTSRGFRGVRACYVYPLLLEDSEVCVLGIMLYGVFLCPTTPYNMCAGMYCTNYAESSGCYPIGRGHVGLGYRDRETHPDVLVASMSGKDYHYSRSPTLHNHTCSPDTRPQGESPPPPEMDVAFPRLTNNTPGPDTYDYIWPAHS